jgi:membrane-bound lytic murein transglycosylase B
VLAVTMLAVACTSDDASRGGSATSGSGTGGSASMAALEPAAAPPTTSLPRTPADVVVPRDAAAVAATLTRVEFAIRAADYDPARSPAWSWEQQVAYGVLAAHPEWLDEVVAAVPAGLRDPVRATLAAGAALSAPDLGHTPTELPDTPAELPDWTIRTPRPPDELLRDYREAEAASGIPWRYLAAIHFVETKMGRIHGNSTAGARGPMQFLPSTWAAYGAGGNIDDDHDAILAAGRYLDAAGGPDDMHRALYAYNPSEAYVTAITGYAEVIGADARAFNGFYGWQVFVATKHGDQLLPEGWTRPR